MIHLLPLTLSSGFVWLGLQSRRPAKPPLVELLVGSSTELAQSTPLNLSLWSRLDEIPVERNLALSTGLLGMTTIGWFGIPLLRLLSVPGLLYLDLYFLRAAYIEWQAEDRIGIAVSDAVLATGLLATRQWGADSLFATLFFASRKLQAKTQEHLAHYWPKRNRRDRQKMGMVEMADEGEHDEVILASSAIDKAPRPRWQHWVDQGALPLLTLGTVSIPFLGLKRALAVLLANFGYDYRVMAPLSTLNHIAMAKEQGILLQDGLVLEKLQQVDLLVLDGAWGATTIADLQLDDSLEIRIAEHDLTGPALATLIRELQANGRVVAYLSPDLATKKSASEADILIAAGDVLVPEADIILTGNQVAQLRRCFEMAAAVAVNQQRGFYLALAPSLINLSGIYFFRFDVVTALLVDYGGSVAGVLNALGPRLQASTVRNTIASAPVADPTRPPL
ncbi:MAG: hypothetical protein R3C14_43110 [Caldilineaceae bacterium]